MLSSGDLQALKKANAHFSDDLLSTLLNEPLIGHGTFWSSADGKSYPIPIRILSFEALYKARDPQYNLPAAKTFAQELKTRFKAAVSASLDSIPATQMKVVSGEETQASSNETMDDTIDVMETYISSAIEAFRNDIISIERIKRDGMTWRGIVAILENALPEVIDQRERNRVAYNFARNALNEIFGDGGWDTEKRSKVGGSGIVTWVVIKNKNQKSIEKF
ncbi:MAG TPA: hypothetical protein VKL21_02210 [Candidatus Methanoperedens sp.]|nr:hypothetical protein [Candidatus Methanoperedens sp.]